MAEQIIRPAAPASGRVTPASFPFYTTGEDNLRVTSWNTGAGVQLKINGRLLDAAGKASPDSWDHTPNTDRSARSTDITLSGSTLLNLTVFAGAGTPVIGQTFVKVDLIRGIGIGAIVLGTILQGYVNRSQAIGWPGSPLQSSLENGGYYRTINATTPIAGSEISEIVPTGARWQVLGFQAVFQASGAVATRGPSLVFAPAGNAIVVSPNPATVTAAQQGTFNWAPGLPLETQIQSGINVGGLPTDLMLLAGGFFGTSTGNMQAGDQWSSARYLVREFLEP